MRIVALQCVGSAAAAPSRNHARVLALVMLYLGRRWLECPCSYFWAGLGIGIGDCNWGVLLCGTQWCGVDDNFQASLQLGSAAGVWQCEHAAPLLAQVAFTTPFYAVPPANSLWCTSIDRLLRPPQWRLAVREYCTAPRFCGWIMGPSVASWLCSFFPVYRGVLTTVDVISKQGRARPCDVCSGCGCEGTPWMRRREAAARTAYAHRLCEARAICSVVA